MFMGVSIVTSMLAYAFLLPQWYYDGAGANIYGRVIGSWISPTTQPNPVAVPTMIFSFGITIVLGYLHSVFVW